MVYIDANTFKCYTTQDEEGNRIPDNEPLFDGKCQAFIEGYCCIPDGYSLKNSNGTIYTGRTVYPWKPYDELDNAQREYERKLLEEYESALSESVPLSALEEAYREGVNSAYES